MKLSNIIDTTKRVVPGYFESTCTQRLENGLGSIYRGVKTVEEMESILRAAEWKHVIDKDVMEGCKAYITTDIKGGLLGIVTINILDDSVVLTAEDPKNTGFVELVANINRGYAATDVSFAIVGPENGEDVLYTFHPGHPIKPSKISATTLVPGTTLTKKEALDMGFEYAKLI